MKNKLWIVPLDITNYIPLDEKRIHFIQKNIEKNQNNLSNHFKTINTLFIKLLNIASDEKKINKNSLNESEKIYMWDAVSTLLILDKNIGQKYITTHVDIDNFGKIYENNQFNQNWKTNIYLSLNPQLFDKEIIKTILPQNNYLFLNFIKKYIF